MGFTYDAGALIAADGGLRLMWVRHRVALESRQVPIVPAGVLAQAWRGGARQVLLSRLLAGCEVEMLDDENARAAGALATRAGTADVVDASVVEGALRRQDVVVTSDVADMRSLAAAAGRHLEVVSP